MRIGINASSVVYGKQTGHGNYTINLVENLAVIDKKNEYILFVAPWNQHYFSHITQENFSFFVCPVRWSWPYYRAIWEQIRLPTIVRKQKLDLFHSPIHTAPKIDTSPCLLTVQAPISLGGGVGQLSMPMKLYWNTIGLTRVRNANGLIAVSNAGKSELINFGKIESHRITVVHLGIGKHFFEYCRSLSPPIEQPYVLWVGKPHRHKNIPTMLESFFILKSEFKIPHKLLMVGPDLQNSEIITKALTKYSLDDEVILHPVVPNEDLPQFYRYADVFLFPSSMETFGIPVLEAMACGTPVVAANISALSEVAGDGAVLVDPDNPQTIAQGVKTVLFNREFRQNLISIGKKRVQLFSWHQAALDTLKIYNNILMEE